VKWWYGIEGQETFTADSAVEAVELWLDEQHEPVEPEDIIIERGRVDLREIARWVVEGINEHDERFMHPEPPDIPMEKLEGEIMALLDESWFGFSPETYTPTESELTEIEAMYLDHRREFEE